MSGHWFQGRHTRTGVAALAVLLASGCVGVEPADYTASPGFSVFRHASSPVVPAPTVLPPPEKPADGTPTAAAPVADQLPVLAASPPVTLQIPAIGARSELLHLGLRDNRSLEVPPGDPGAPASWYTGSPTPGQRGPAVILGHVNATDGGPGIFAGLRALKPGDTIEIARQDGTTAVFSVERAEQYAKDAFPTMEVYGNTAGAELRLITCDGYDPTTGKFDDNYVVYATLVA